MKADYFARQFTRLLTDFMGQFKPAVEDVPETNDRPEPTDSARARAESVVQHFNCGFVPGQTWTQTMLVLTANIAVEISAAETAAVTAERVRCAGIIDGLLDTFQGQA